MKGRNLFLTALIMLVAGVIFILLANTLASVAIVVGGGIMFIVAGGVNIFVLLGARDAQGRAKNGIVGTALGWLASAAAIILGLCMLIFQATFIPLVSFMLAVLVMFTAVYQLLLLIFGSRPVKLHPLFYIVPVILIIAAVIIFFQRSDTGHADHAIMYITGGAFALFGLASVVEGMVIAYRNHQNRKAAAAASQAVAEVSEPASSSKADDATEKAD